MQIFEEALSTALPLLVSLTLLGYRRFSMVLYSRTLRPGRSNARRARTRWTEGSGPGPRTAATLDASGLVLGQLDAAALSEKLIQWEAGRPGDSTLGTTHGSVNAARYSSRSLSVIERA